MTTAAKESRTRPLIGAPSACFDSWDAVDWPKVEKQVWRLQMRIAKAVREGKPGKAKALQWTLTHSFSAKLLAVKRVVQNQGGKTAGVDGIVWKKPEEKMQAARSLRRRGYNPLPLRRVYIPKKSGNLRPLGIPTMTDRAMQALHLTALEPVYEMQAEKNVYGFRPVRSTADAIEQCFIILAKKHSPQWIFEGDIKACFDSISHDWMIANIPTDKTVLAKWLSMGYMEKRVFYPTREGTPQGGIVSPTLMNFTLSGMEKAVKAAVSRGDKVNTVVYADDFIITGASREVLEQKVIPVVTAFLRERGLELSAEKSKITHIREGFDFLGFNVRKYRDKFIRKPAKKSIKAFLDNVRGIIKKRKTIKTEDLIRLLNPKIRGWANYYRHVVSKKTFAYIDYCIFKALWQWIKRRHRKKSAQWIRKKYFRRHGLRNWIFSAATMNEEGKTVVTDLYNAAYMPIKRHIKIRGEASPYNPAFRDYFEWLKSVRKSGGRNTDEWWILPRF